MHSPFQCMWRQWLRPLLYGSKAGRQLSEVPEDVDKEMVPVLLEYVCHNAEDFHTWVMGAYYRKNRRTLVPEQKWAEYIKKHSFFCSDTGPILNCLLYVIVLTPYFIAGVAAATGVVTWLRFFNII